MPLKNTGKTIQQITKKAKKAIIKFDDKSTLEVALDTLEMFTLYVGKELSKQDINEMISFSNKTFLMEYALSLIKKGHYSENRMIRKLSNKINDESSIKYVMKKLKEFDLINDLALIEELCCYYDELKYGQNKIIAKLIAQELKEKDISKIKFPETIEKEKAVSLLDKLIKNTSSLPFKEQKNTIYKSLLAKGFTSSNALYAIEQIQKDPNQDELDYEKLLKDLEKQYDRYSFKYTRRELKDKVFTSLLRKGYNIKNIAKAWGENYD